MTDLRNTGQIAEVLQQADEPPLRLTHLVTETLFQAMDPRLRASQHAVEVLVSLTGGGSDRRRTVVVASLRFERATPMTPEEHTTAISAL